MPSVENALWAADACICGHPKELHLDFNSCEVAECDCMEFANRQSITHEDYKHSLRADYPPGLYDKLEALKKAMRPVEPRDKVISAGPPLHEGAPHRPPGVFIELPPPNTIKWIISFQHNGQTGYVEKELPRDMIKQLQSPVIYMLLAEMDDTIKALIQALEEKERNAGQDH